MAPKIHSTLSRRTFVAALAAGVAGAAAPSVAQARDDLLREEAITVTARPLPYFDSNNRDGVKFGPLEFRGGVSLYSSSSHFGGLSGLIVEPDGSGLLAVSDVGTWLSADIVYEGDKPAGLANARMGPLRDRNGQPLTRLDKKQQDSESLTLVEGSLAKGSVLVGFERNHRIVRYAVEGRKIAGPALGALEPPSDVRRMPKNQGFEAVSVLKGGPHKGSVIAFAERFTRGSGYHTGWIWVGGQPQKMQLKDIDGFDITDAASLDNGDLLVLERRFRWMEGVQMRLRLLKGGEIVPGAKLSGQILLQANGDFQIDNMEGVAVHRDRLGRQVVSLISDDNFNHFLQRTLLLQFTLADGAKVTRT